MWFIVGKIGSAVEPLAQSSETALKVQEMNVKITNQLENILRQMGYNTDTTGGSGLKPAE